MIAVLPGTKWSEGLCKKIKERNEKILLISPEEHPYCEKYADEFLRTNIFDINKITTFCQFRRIDAVMSDECDIAVPVVAELGQRLNVKTISREMAALYTDKFLMREFSRKYGIRYPEYQLCRRVNEAIDFFRKIGTKIIIKPLDSNASHGVFTIESEQDLTRHFDETMSFSRMEKGVLAERYIEGTEFTIDGIKTPGKHYTLAVSKKKHFGHNENIAYELFFIHQDDEYDYNRLRKLNDQFVEKSGLEYGFTHAEYKYENGTFYLIEIAARGGGNQISSIITQFMSGRDTYNYLIDCALGGVADGNFSILKDYKNRAAVMHFFHVPAGGGKVVRINGEEILKNNPAILDYGLNFKVGDEIHDAENDSVRIGYYIAGMDTESELRALMAKIESVFRIEVE